MSVLETRKNRRRFLFGGAGLVMSAAVLVGCGSNDDNKMEVVITPIPTKSTGSMGLKDPNLTPDPTQAALLEEYERKNGTPEATPDDASPTPEFKG